MVNLSIWDVKEFFQKISKKSDISRLIIEHQTYRNSTLNMIPSENLLSPAVAAAIASDLEARYTLPYSGELHGEIVENGYRGTRYMDEVENETNKKIQKLFNVPYSNVRPLSGHLAAMITMGALLKPGDTISFLPVDGGGYDGYEPHLLPKLLQIKAKVLPFDYSNWDIDYNSLKKHFKSVQPNAVIIGSSFPLFPFDIKRVREELDENVKHETMIFFDASHIFGLIAGKAYPDPIKDGADIFYGSTHKTFFGPQRGIILTHREELMEKINTDFFWRWQDNSHWGSIAALGIATEELLKWGEPYAKLIVQLSQKLGKMLSENDFFIRCPHRGFSKTHQIHVLEEEFMNKWKFGIVKIAGMLEESGIIVDNVGRMGTQELARSGVDVSDIGKIADWFIRTLKSTSKERVTIRNEIKNFKETLKIKFTL